MNPKKRMIEQEREDFLMSLGDAERRELEE